MRFIIAIIVIVWSGSIAYSQDWKVEYKPSRAFIENKGQFKSENAEKIGGIDFAVDYGSTRIFFGKKGVSFDFVEAQKKSKEERQEILSREASSVKEHKENEKLFGKFMYTFDQVSFDWVGANPEAVIEGINEFSDYHSYSFENNEGKIENINEIKGYKKIRYKNIYPGIDIEYEIHPESGVKYALYVAPNADPSLVAMQYDKNIFIKEGTIHIPTAFGDILDHAPITFYKSNNNNIIDSRYNLKGNIVSFEIGNYEKSKGIVIDPWVQTPTFNTDWNCIWEVDYDGAGNVYAIGGTMPMKLQKYSPAGALLWTYNTPYDTTSWLGGFGTNDAGESYVTRGSVAGITKVNTGGGVEWTAAGSGPIGESDEYWTVQFSCDESRVIIGGTKLSIFSFDLEPAIFDIDVNNGNVLNSLIVHPGSFLPAREVRSLAASPQSRYYWLSHDTIGYTNDNFGLCNNNPSNINKIDNEMGFGYKCENYRYDNSGIMALRADENFLFVNRGNQIQKRDLQTLAIIATAPIPNGNFTNVFLSGNIVHNSGIDIDDCGNIFVGSTNQVVQFDSDLNQINTFPTSFRVFDVHVAPNGRLIAGGSTGTSSSNARDGYIQQWNVGACDPLALICCDANFCQEGPFCLADSPITIEVSQSGGTFSGPGVDPVTGVFDPAAAGAGTHTITYTLACGSESLEFVVDPCDVLTVCEETNGDLTVTGGVGPYSWADEQTITTPINTQAECESCGFFWIGFGPLGTCSEDDCTSTDWVSYANGTTTNPPSSFPIQITDSQGSSVIINNAGEIAPCDNTPCTNLTVTITAESDVSCNGANNGSATVNATGGNGSYTYTWTPGNLNGPTQGGLSPNTYTVNVVDSDGCAGSVIVEITEPSAIVAGATPTDASCGSNDGEITLAVSGGSPGYTFNWSNGASTQNITGLAPGAYSVTITDDNGCTEVVNATVNALNGPTITIDNSSDVSCNGETDGSATVSASGGSGGYTYNWLPGNLTGATQNNLSAGSYDVTVTDSDGCPSTITVVIDEPAAIDLVMSSNPSSCTVDDGSATVVASGGAGGYTYSWSPVAGSSATLSNVGAGSYTVTVTDMNGCSEQASVNVSSVNGPIIALDNSTDASCNGETDGSATISVSGGTPVYTYSWSPSGGVNATENNLGAGTYTVTVVDDAGCTSLLDITIGEPDEIVISGTTTDATCAENDGSIQTNVSGGNGGFTYSWSPSGTGGNPTGLSPGTYDVTVTDANGCSAQESFVVGFDNTLFVEIVPNAPIIGNGEQVTLNVVTTPGTTNPTYTWSPSDGLSCDDCATPIASPSTTTTYTVTVVDANGCTGQATVTVFVSEPCGLPMVPTIFSPNGDGNNDELCILGNCIIEMELSIFNRWGEKIFESTDQNICWDGTHREKAVNTGVFVYKLRAVNSDGEEFIDSGNITLVR